MPLEILEGSAHAGLSAAVGRKAKIELTTGEVIPTLWIMLLADSTRYRKSTAIDLLGRRVRPSVGSIRRAFSSWSQDNLVNLVTDDATGMKQSRAVRGTDVELRLNNLIRRSGPAYVRSP